MHYLYNITALILIALSMFLTINKNPMFLKASTKQRHLKTTDYTSISSWNIETELHEIMQITEEEMLSIFLCVHMKEIELQKKKKISPHSNKTSYLKIWAIEFKAKFDLRTVWENEIMIWITKYPPWNALSHLLSLMEIWTSMIKWPDRKNIQYSEVL